MKAHASTSTRLRFLCAFSALLPSAIIAAESAPDAPNRPIPAAPDEHIAQVDGAVPSAARAKPKQPRRVLVSGRTEGFYHTSIPTGLHALKRLGERTGAFQVDFNHEMSAFTAENLRAYDAVILLSTTQLKFQNAAHRQALLDFVHSGKGLVGIHAASDNFPTWPEGQALMGGIFHSHPWVAGDTVAVKLDEPDHVLNRAFKGKGFWIREEIYQIVGPYSREKQRVLMSLDMSKRANERPAKAFVRTDRDFPIGWLKREGKGRVFYSSLGHNDQTFWIPEVLEHFLDGIQYAIGDLEASDIPSAQLLTPPNHALAPATPLTLLERKHAERIHEATILQQIVAYDNGADTTALKIVQNGLRGSDAAGRTRFETELLAAVAKTTSLSTAAKYEIGLLLSEFGGAKSVPVLTSWTQDSATADAAVRALGILPAPEAAEALTQMLTSAPDALRPAILDALASRRAIAAAPAVSAQATSKTPTVSEAALASLGRLASPQAHASLSAAQVAEAQGESRDWALIHAATALAAKSADKQAISTLTSLLSAQKPAPIRLSAASGLLQSGSAESLAAVVPLLSDEAVGTRLAPIVMRAVVKQPAQARATALQSVLAASSAAPVRVNLLQAADELGDPTLLPLVQASLATEDPAIRAAALTALGGIARDVATSEPLFAALSGTADRAAAIAALSRVRASGLDERLRQEISRAAPAVKVALLNVASQRVDRGAMPLVLEAAAAQERDVRQAGFRAMGRLVRGEDLPMLIKLRESLRTPGERQHWHEALLNSVRFRDDGDATTNILAEQLNATQGAERGTYAAALTLLETDRALQVLREALSDPSTEQRKELVRSLSTARNARSSNLLIDVAEKGADETERILALRGHLDIVDTLHLRPNESVAVYRRAWKAAIRDEERLAIIGYVDNLWGDEARAFAKELHQQMPSAPLP